MHGMASAESGGCGEWTRGAQLRLFEDLNESPVFVRKLRSWLEKALLDRPIDLSDQLSYQKPGSVLFFEL
jgi:hypothetical protein